MMARRTRATCKSVLVVGDVHARKKHFATVLHRAGAMDVHGRKNPDVWVIQLGDLVSLGYDEPEAEFLLWAEQYIDEYLVGNHEAFCMCAHPQLSFIGYDGEPYTNFKGEEIFPGEADVEAVAIVRRWADEGRYKVAARLGRWLLNHAGMRPALQKFYREHEATLDDIVDDLNRRWRSCVAQPGLDDPYITDGSEHRGGILWQRFHHLRAGYADVHIPQIVGHSSNCGPEKYRDNLWCIDSEGGVVGLLTQDEGETFECITSLPPDAQKPRYVRKWMF